MSRFALKTQFPRTAARRLSLVATGAVLATALLPACTSAATGYGTGKALYRAFVCSTPTGAAVPVDPTWQKSTTNSPFAIVRDDCSKRGPMGLSLGDWDSTVFLAHGHKASWTFSTPYYTSLRGAIVTRNGYARSARSDYRADAELVVDQDGAPQRIESCIGLENCSFGYEQVGDNWVRKDTAWALSGGNRLQITAQCGGVLDGYCAYSGYARAEVQIHRIEFLIVDAVAPDLRSLSGTALAEGSQAGERTVNASFDDLGSGLYEVVVEIDGEVAARAAGTGIACADAGLRAGRDFTSVAPCDTGFQSHDLRFDSRKFDDGKHRLRVYATDAAGNETQVTEREVAFENFGAPVAESRPTISAPVGAARPGDLLTATQGRWNTDGRPATFAFQWERSADGANWDPFPTGRSAAYTLTRDDVGKYMRVRVTATTSEGSGVSESDRTEKVESGATISPAGFGDGTESPAPQANVGDAGGAQLVLDREQRTVEVKHGAKIVLTGRLEDAKNQPIANAKVDIFEQLVLTAAPWRKIGTVTTDSQGGYSFKPTTTASRRIRFAYADSRDTAQYRATREVLVSVQGAMSISSKRKVLRPGETIRLKGRLTVDSLPKTGTWVEIQVLDAGVWRTIATRKTSSKGLWTFKHRLRQSSGITFRFRSRLRVVGDVASAETTSPTLKVRVR